MPVHVAITLRILPGKEDEFKQALRKFMGESFTQGGVHGASMITSLPGDESEIGILRTFQDPAERDAFYQSEQFKKWEAYALTLTEPPVYRDLNGLEFWFLSTGAPPRWKMALVILLGVFPTSLLLFYTVGLIIKDLPVPVRLLITSACMVGLLNWLVMPFLTKALHRWLKP
ncbi:antibiotic biosynthesis monooxygenase [Mucilaginibacter gynuensis]|uniref:Antibiotic biosynthesis monooxygenase n=1 Tax=Mucilaginibacter gynuensis TaxID=1302236 RepID=A0ABP8GR73_9SPHI